MRVLGFILLCAATCLLAFKKYKPASISAKSIDKNIAKVKDGLYAHKYETTNSEYNLFVQSVKAIDPQLAQQYLVDSAKWDTELRAPMVQYYHRHVAYDNYPVVNISHDNALAYCKWLTSLYNTDPKRKFNKVEFILPSQSDWTFAAQGGRKQAIYPWGKYFLRDKSGHPLCNFNIVSDQSIYSDTMGNPVVAKRAYVAGKLSELAFYTAHVKSFTPNDYGIYNMSGNAAEMIDQPGEAMGGSWKSYGGEVTTISKKHYDGPAPEIGFRVFMKVIQE